MPDRIDNLTAAQEAAIPAHMDRWVEICTCTDDADWDMAVEAAKLIYEVVNVPFPSEVIRARNPVEAVRLGHRKARDIDGVGGKTSRRPTTSPPWPGTTSSLTSAGST